MPISDFLDCMNQSITLERYVSRNSYGKATYGIAETINNCRVVYKDFWFRKTDGSEVNAKGIVWLGSAVRMTVEDKITLPDGTDHPILMVESYPDEDGNLHHTKVLFG